MCGGGGLEGLVEEDAGRGGANMQGGSVQGGCVRQDRGKGRCVCVGGGWEARKGVCVRIVVCVCVVCVEGPRLGGLVEEDAGEGDALELVRPHPHARRAHNLRGTFFI